MRFSKGKSIFEYQPEILLSQANPVSDTFYPVLGATNHVRVITLSTRVDWGVTQPTNLRIRVTIDGRTIIFTLVTPVTITWYDARVLYANADDAAQQLTAFGGDRNFLIDGRVVSVEAAITWAVTQPTFLYCRLKWGRLI